MKITVPIPEYTLTMRGDASDCRLTVEASPDCETVVVFAIDDIRIEMTTEDTVDLFVAFGKAVEDCNKLAKEEPA